MTGSICHFEIPSKDPETASDFYRKLFKWKIDSSSIPDYPIIETPSPPKGGIEKREPFTPGVMVYIEVEDVASTLRQIKEAGGTIIKQKTEIPNIGHFGIFSDLDGNIIGVFQDLKDS